ncbi:MAG TPA: hypothetical protein DCE52_14515 [Rhodobacteraceae bacterium]|nr:hypothetical protein [Paracoccaceae bacterium]
MALITMPSSPAFQKSEWGIRRAVAVSESPFTGKQQTYKYAKACWYATLSLPPMKREQAAEWQSFFMMLEGRANTFLLGDPDAKSVTGGNDPSSVSVASGAAIDATSVNLTIGSGKKINKGSYIQFGTGADSRLHMVVDNNTGNGSVTIQPPLKSAVTTSTAVNITNAKGVFRMDSNDLTWSANELSVYGITFSCMEVV